MAKKIKVSDALIDDVIERIKIDLEYGDTTAIAAMLSFVPRENLIQFLPEVMWPKYKFKLK